MRTAHLVVPAAPQHLTQGPGFNGSCMTVMQGHGCWWHLHRSTTHTFITTTPIHLSLRPKIHISFTTWFWLGGGECCNWATISASMSTTKCSLLRCPLMHQRNVLKALGHRAPICLDPSIDRERKEMMPTQEQDQEEEKTCHYTTPARTEAQKCHRPGFRAVVHGSSTFKTTSSLTHIGKVLHFFICTSTVANPLPRGDTALWYWLEANTAFIIPVGIMRVTVMICSQITMTSMASTRCHMSTWSMHWWPERGLFQSKKTAAFCPPAALRLLPPNSPAHGHVSAVLQGKL